MNQYSIKEIHEKASWDAFVLSFQSKTFLHSWEWGMVQERTGERIWRIGVYDGERMVGAALFILIVAKRGRILFCPHGPLLSDWNNKETFAAVLADAKRIAREERAHVIRMSPFIEEGSEHAAQFIEHGFRSAPIYMHAEITWTLDITPDAETLMNQMRKNTRGAIRKAKKDGVVVAIGESDALLNRFYALHEATVARQGFVPFSKKFLREEVSAFAPDNIIIAVGSVAGGDLAGAVVPLYDGVGYYHHGASLSSKIPASQYVQWKIIQELKKRGARSYNFWGIAEAGDWKHPPRAWAGLTKFKQGFGGERKEYLHAQDLPLSWRYWPLWLVETQRRRARS